MIAPEPPVWALEAGLPAPEKGESFTRYCSRLGIDGDRILWGLDDRTLCLANVRLATAIKKIAPAAFIAYADARSAAVKAEMH